MILDDKLAIGLVVGLIVLVLLWAMGFFKLIGLGSKKSDAWQMPSKVYEPVFLDDDHLQLGLMSFGG